MRNTSLSLAIAGLLAVTGSAIAATETGTFEVTATVVAACAIDTTATLAFGNYNPVTGTAVDGTTTVGVRCTNAHPYNIGLNLGSNADVSTRRMSDAGVPAAFLTYELYSESGRTTVWGDTVGTNTVAETGSGVEQSKTIYGRIAGSQSTAKLGSYSDTVTITVTF